MPTKNQDPEGHTNVSLHPREVALINIIRRLGNGTLASVGIKDGLPDKVVLAEQQILFGNSEHLGRLFELEGKFVPLKRG